MFQATYSRAPSAAAAIANIPYAICSASNSIIDRVGVHTITDAAMTAALMIIAVMIAFFIFFSFPCTSSVSPPTSKNKPIGGDMCHI